MGWEERKLVHFVLTGFTVPEDSLSKDTLSRAGPGQGRRGREISVRVGVTATRPWGQGSAEAAPVQSHLGT